MKLAMKLSRILSLGKDVPLKLQPEELKRLRRFEDLARSGPVTFVEIGSALAAIRDSGAYRKVCRSFSSYCFQKLGYRRAYAYQLIRAAEVVNFLAASNFDSLPQNEAQVRPLIHLEPNEVKRVWTEALSAYPEGNIPARVIKQLVGKVVKKPKGPKEEGVHTKERTVDACLLNLEEGIRRKVPRSELRQRLHRLKQALKKLDPPIK